MSGGIDVGGGSGGGSGPQGESGAVIIHGFVQPALDATETTLYTGHAVGVGTILVIIDSGGDYAGRYAVEADTGSMLTLRLKEVGSIAPAGTITDESAGYYGALTATITVGSVTTVTDADPATVTNSGTKFAAILDFEIPQGEKGDAATIAVGTVNTVAPGDPATVTNTGNSAAAVFAFEIPQGDPGDAATIAVGSVTSVDSTDPPTVTNSGSTSAAVFDFEIPAGVGSVYDISGSGSGSAVGAVTTVLANWAPPADGTWSVDANFVVKSTLNRGARYRRHALLDVISGVITFPIAVQTPFADMEEAAINAANVTITIAGGNASINFNLVGIGPTTLNGKVRWAAITEVP